MIGEQRSRGEPQPPSAHRFAEGQGRSLRCASLAMARIACVVASRSGLRRVSNQCKRISDHPRLPPWASDRRPLCGLLGLSPPGGATRALRAGRFVSGRRLRATTKRFIRRSESPAGSRHRRRTGIFAGHCQIAGCMPRARGLSATTAAGSTLPPARGNRLGLRRFGRSEAGAPLFPKGHD